MKGIVTIGQQNLSSTSGLVSINWNEGINVLITLTENTSITFVNPLHPCHLQLEVIQDSAGNHTLSLPNIKWASKLSLSTNPNEISIISLYYDGTNYLGTSFYNFK